jgi:hypothetical protein
MPQDRSTWYYVLQRVVAKFSGCPPHVRRLGESVGVGLGSALFVYLFEGLGGRGRGDG